MKILVTGGCGFIGSHFVDLTASKNDDILIIDNLLVGKIENIDYANKIGKIKFFKKDILDLNSLKSNFSDVDAIVHFAARTGVIESLEKPEEFANVNISGTISLLNLCREFDIPKFVLASTGAVYGNQDPPFVETMIPDPISPYAASKVAAENFAKSYGNTYGINSTILRFTNVYGPRKSFGPYANVIPKFVRSILRDSPITIFGDGTQERDFIYVKDVANACYNAIQNGKNDVYNIGTGTNTSLNELINILEEIFSQEIQKQYVEFRVGESKIAYSSIDKAKTLLSYSPQFPLKDGLIEYVEFEKTQI